MGWDIWAKNEPAEQITDSNMNKFEAETMAKEMNKEVGEIDYYIALSDKANSQEPSSVV